MKTKLIICILCCLFLASCGTSAAENSISLPAKIEQNVTNVMIARNNFEPGETQQVTDWVNSLPGSSIQGKQVNQVLSVSVDTPYGQKTNVYVVVSIK